MLRRAGLAGITTLIALSWTAGAEAACKPGQLGWKVEGRERCVKVARVPAVSQPASAALTERVLTIATRKAPVGRRAALPAGARVKLAKAAAALGRRVAALELKARAPAAVRASGWRAALLRATTLTSPTFTEGGVTARATVSVSDSGVATIGLDASVKSGLDTVTIEVDVTPGFDPPTERCPDVDGKVRSRDESGARLTTKTTRGRKVLSATTARVTTITETVGQVGDDGFLAGSSSTVTSKTGSFSRGLGVETTSVVTVAGGKEGTFTPTGAPKVDATIRSATATSAVERAAERLVAGRQATSGDAAKYAGRDAARGRDRVREKEAQWTSLEKNPCIDVAWTPAPPGAVEPGQSIGVTGRVIRKDGKPAATASTWAVNYVGEGTFARPGPSFTATGGEPGGTGQTVLATVIVASKSGRVQAPWFAKGGELPAVFTATATQKEVISSGVVLEFDLTARWERSASQTNPDGTRSATYSATSATTTRWVYDQTTGGCAYHGEGAGGTVVFGDVELRFAADGSVTYGFVADVDLGQQTMPKTGGPMGCPASISPNLKAIIQARRKPDSSLYPAPAGAYVKPKFDVTVAGLTDSIGDSDGFRDVTMGWTLTGR